MNQQRLPDWIVSLDHDAAPETVGTKAYNLARLHAAGFNVPPALFIPTFDDGREGMQSEATYLQAIDEFSSSLIRHLQSSDGWAVRSSATVEDLEDKSMAGRFDTYFISRPEELARAVRKVWDSARLANVGAESMGVVVQKTIEADFAGVAFSKDPIDDYPTTIIEMCRGKGESLVDGTVTPWRVRIADSKHQVPEGFPGGVLTQIDAGVQKLAEIHGYAADVEWAVKDGILYWLQVRPITTKVAPKFEISEAQREQLQGLWIRIRHCFAPQKPLVVSMNLPGLFDYPDWKSLLVNQFHYVQMKSPPKSEIREGDFERNLGRWDRIEEEYEAIFDERLDVDLGVMELDRLWDELQQRAELKRGFFPKYYDSEFHRLRTREYETVTEYIDTAFGGEVSADMKISELLGGLETKTDEKQHHLIRLADLMSRNPGRDIRQTEQWDLFMRGFGYEAASTHLFYVPMLKENPGLVIDMIKQNAAHPQVEERTSRHWIEHKSEIEAKLPAGQVEGFRKHLLRLRRCMKRTEDDDYLLQKSTAQVREILLELGRRLVDKGIVEDGEDIFYLNEDELKAAAISDNTDIPVLRSSIEERKRVFNNSRLLSPPALIVNGRPKNPKTRSDHGVLSGTAASPGIASGTVVVVNDPFSRNVDTLPANSIVVVPIVTPAFAYMLIGCAAIVTEIGGMASHGAIVAREMGVPAVVGIKGIREQLQSGMTVTVDGTNGRVILAQAHH